MVKCRHLEYQYDKPNKNHSTEVQNSSPCTWPGHFQISYQLWIPQRNGWLWEWINYCTCCQQFLGKTFVLLQHWRPKLTTVAPLQKESENGPIHYTGFVMKSESTSLKSGLWFEWIAHISWHWRQTKLAQQLLNIMLLIPKPCDIKEDETRQKALFTRRTMCIEAPWLRKEQFKTALERANCLLKQMLPLP